MSPDKHTGKRLFNGWILAGVIALLLACSGWPSTRVDRKQTDPEMVVGVTWQWTRTVTPVETVSVDHPERYTLRFLGDGKIDAQFDCNQGHGTYTMSKGKLSFGPFMSTRMACPPDSLDWRFEKDIQQVVSFFIMNDRLHLELPMDSGTLQFKPAP